MKNKEFLIVTLPQISGGTVVLHLLAKMLNDKGYNAKVIYLNANLYNKDEIGLKYWLSNIKLNFRYDVKCILGRILKKKFLQDKRFKGIIYQPVKNVPRKRIPIVNKNTIVIYPDVYYANILKTKNVIRWLLFHNRFENDVNAYGKNDLFFCFREIFNDPLLNPTGRKLFLVNFDSKMYRKYNDYKREGNCYIIRKGKNRGDLPKHFDGPIIDDMSEEQIVEAFNKYEYCYSYDTQTFYTSIAAVCGCIPIIMMEPDFTIDHYVKKDDKRYGKAYGHTDSEIEYAKKTRKELMERLKEINNNNQVEIEAFLKTCEEYFND